MSIILQIEPIIVEEKQTIEEVSEVAVNEEDNDEMNTDNNGGTNNEQAQPSITISTWNKEERWFESVVKSLDNDVSNKEES